MDVKKILREGVYWIDLGQDREKCGLFWTHLGTIKWGEFPGWAKDIDFFKKFSTAWG
jgi:hypothetical protein